MELVEPHAFCYDGSYWYNTERLPPKEPISLYFGRATRKHRETGDRHLAAAVFVRI